VGETPVFIFVNDKLSKLAEPDEEDLAPLEPIHMGRLTVVSVHLRSSLTVKEISCAEKGMSQALHRILRLQLIAESYPAMVPLCIQYTRLATSRYYSS